jgi:hypothetical protein
VDESGWDPGGEVGVRLTSLERQRLRGWVSRQRRAAGRSWSRFTIWSLLAKNTAGIGSRHAGAVRSASASVNEVGAVRQPGRRRASTRLSWRFNQVGAVRQTVPRIAIIVFFESYVVWL